MQTLKLKWLLFPVTLVFLLLFRYKFSSESSMQEITEQQNSKESFVENVIKSCNELQNTILGKYGKKYEQGFFINGWYDLEDQGERFQDKILDAIINQRNFTVSFTGISNTAGHDNLFSQSYPVVFGKIMGPIFSSAGININIRNGAMGNTDFYPYSWCVEDHAGSNADVISWEMSMQVMKHQCNDTASMVESWVRMAVKLPSHPVPVLLNCQPSKAMCSPKHQWKHHTHHVFEKVIGRCDKTSNAHDLSLWYKDYGLHSLSLEDLIKHFGCDEPLFDKTKMYGGKVGTPSIKSWHPGPEGHLLMAEVMATNYAELIKKAVKKLEGIKNDVTLDDLKDMNFREIALKKLDLFEKPNSKMIQPSYCTLEQCTNAEKFQCYTTFYPNWEGHLNLLKLVNDSQIDFEERFQYLPTNGSRWEILVNEPNRIIKKFQPENKNWPIDRKWVLAGKSTAGPLNIDFVVGTLETEETAPILLCRPNPAESTELEKQNQSPESLNNLSLELNSKIVSAVRIGPQSLASICWTLSVRIGNGQHRLKISALSNKDEGIVRISHLIIPK